MSLVHPLEVITPPPAHFVNPLEGEPPHALARAAAAAVQESLATEAPADDGKMYGVLVVRTPQGGLGYLKAFSGMREGAWHVPGFVPPLFDAKRRQGFEAAGARVVADLIARAHALEADAAVAAKRREREAFVHEHEAAMATLARTHARSREERKRQREACSGQRADSDLLHALAQQSRADKAEVKRLVAAHQEVLCALQRACLRHERRVRACVRLRHIVCRRLMHMIHDCYVITNARGERRSLRTLFAPQEPPSGAADCAAPKLLAYALREGLTPLALAEFWWGPPPAGGGRQAGAFYPPCRGKCGPLLPFMMEGLALTARAASARSSAGLPVIYEDAWIVVVNKPHGLLSVPGRGHNGDDSVLQRLRSQLPKSNEVMLVHRLDQDTSGLLVAAKTQAAYVALQKQFLAREVNKVYEAWVSGTLAGEEGRIHLPLRLDLHERPRQMVDHVHGRPATTLWRVMLRAGAHTLLELRPITGRTHQLRVHSAHHEGLGSPIVGDRLYGVPVSRLWLHAAALSFRHPLSGKVMTFTQPSGFAEIDPATAFAPP